MRSLQISQRYAYPCSDIYASTTFHTRQTFRTDNLTHRNSRFVSKLSNSTCFQGAYYLDDMRTY